MHAFLLRPRVADLVFQAYARPLHPELFDVVAVRAVRHADYAVEVRLTRTGHVVVFAKGDVCLTEVADIDQSLASKRRLMRFPVRGEHAFTTLCAADVTYRTSFQLERMSDETFRHFTAEIANDGARRGLFHNFCPHPRLSLAPLGFVNLEAKPGCLFVTAFHTFPEENAVLKSQTLIETARRRGPTASA